jgi:hypothetical protein
LFFHVLFFVFLFVMYHVCRHELLRQDLLTKGRTCALAARLLSAADILGGFGGPDQRTLLLPRLRNMPAVRESVCDVFDSASARSTWLYYHSVVHW